MIDSQSERPSPRRRWWMGLVVLCGPLFLSLFTAAHSPLVPQTLPEIGSLVAFRLIPWCVCLGLAFFMANETASSLRVDTFKGWRTVLGGVAGGIVVWVLALVGLLLLWKIPGWHSAPTGASSLAVFKQFAHHPAQVVAAVILLCVIEAGLFELWRAGMLAGLVRLYPQALGPGWGSLRLLGLVALVSVFFIHSGWSIGSLWTAWVSNLIFGAILFYRNYWEAAIAHALILILATLGPITMVLNAPAERNRDLAEAAGSDDLPTVQLLLEDGAEVNSTSLGDKGKRATPLERALGKGDINVAKFLVYRGADVNLRDEAGNRPLVSAVQAGYLVSIQFLLDEGAVPDLADDHGVTPLAAAQKYGDRKILDLVNHALSPPALAAPSPASTNP